MAPYCAIPRDYLSDAPLCQGPLNVWFQTGGFPDLDLSFLFCPFWEFPDFSGIFMICPSLLYQPMNSTYENSPERVRDTIRTSPEKVGNPPGLETPRLSFSQLLRAMGFLVSQHGQLQYPLPLFSAFPPWRACEVEVPYPFPPKGYFSDTCAIPYETRQNACDTPFCDTISKGYCAIWGGISLRFKVSQQSLMF